MRLRLALLLLSLCSSSAAAQLRVTVVDSAGRALAGARVELWSVATLITVRTADLEGVAAFTEAETARATDALARSVGYAPTRASIAGTDGALTLRLQRLAQSLPAVTIASVARSCPQREQPEARAVWRRVSARYREPSYEGRSSTIEQRQGTVDERDVGFFYESELRTGSRAYTAAGMQGGIRQIERRGYLYALDSTHTLELFGGWRYPAIEAELSGHFATEQFGQRHDFAEVSRSGSTVTLRFCARDRSGNGLDGTLQLSEAEGFVEARWRFWNPRDRVEQAGGAATFASASPDAPPAPLTSTSGLFWRRLPSGKFIQRWQRFHEWTLLEASDGAAEPEAPLADCRPAANYILCSAISVNTGGRGRISTCTAMPYRCFEN